MGIRPSALLVLSLFIATQCLAADDLPARFDHAPNKPYPPEEARQKMTVPPGFHVDLVASEPDIVNPIAMTFDDRGRIWVTQSVEYPRKSAGPGATWSRSSKAWTSRAMRRKSRRSWTT